MYFFQIFVQHYFKTDIIFFSFLQQLMTEYSFIFNLTTPFPFQKISVTQASSQSLHHTKKLPKFTLECQCVDMKMYGPMYTNRLVYTTCQLPNPPSHMFQACFSSLSVKVIGFCSRLVLSSRRHTTIITPCGASYNQRNILKPQYWKNPDIAHEEITFESGTLIVIVSRVYRVF